MRRACWCILPLQHHNCSRFALPCDDVLPRRHRGPRCMRRGARIRVPCWRSHERRNAVSRRQRVQRRDRAPSAVHRRARLRVRTWITLARWLDVPRRQLLHR